MIGRARNGATVAIAAAAALLVSSAIALAQSCPELLASARRLVLVTTDGLSTAKATMRLYQRAAPGAPWQPVREAEPVLVGRNGLAWALPYRRFAARGEPIKIEGDKRAPAGVFRLGASIGHAPSNKPGYLQLTPGTVCVDAPSSPAYNTITSRDRVGWKVPGENMWRIPHYRHGLLVDFPTSRARRGGSCIFVHLKLPRVTGTAGCVAVDEPALLALQDFAAPGAVLAMLPVQATRRFGGCLPLN
ncbi:MAG: hypothetical protein AB7P20_07915 [Rhizobiaceae bacterium]